MPLVNHQLSSLAEVRQVLAFVAKHRIGKGVSTTPIDRPDFTAAPEPGAYIENWTHSAAPAEDDRTRYHIAFANGAIANAGLMLVWIQRYSEPLAVEMLRGDLEPRRGRSGGGSR